jgi:hypothetical protein
MQGTEQKYRVRSILRYITTYFRVPELDGFVRSGRAAESEHQIWNESVYVKYTAKGSKNGTGANIEFSESTIGGREGNTEETRNFH